MADGELGRVDSAVDWDALRTAAREAMTHAYAPYSKFPVGVAGLVDDGRVVTGCNVENASYGLGLCAECGMVSDLARSGGGRLVAVACVGGDGQPLMPCGRCRQLLWEHGGAELPRDVAANRWNPGEGIEPKRRLLAGLDALSPSSDGVFAGTRSLCACWLDSSTGNFSGGGALRTRQDGRSSVATELLG